MHEQLSRLAERLVEHGLAHAFGVTGSGASLRLITELEARGVRYLPTSHEAAAAIMAGAAGRASGRLSVSISIKGPGLSNMLPGIVHNYFEGNPALSLSEAYGADSPPGRMHKRLAHGPLLASVVKGFDRLGRVESRLGSFLDLARQEVPGPVHLDLCGDRGGPEPSTPRVQTAPASTPSDVMRAMDRVKRARRPLVIVGSLGLRRPWGSALSHLQVPVFTTAAAKGVVDERSPQSAGVWTGDGKRLAPESHLVSEADFVLGLGLRNTEVLSPKPFGHPTVLVDEVGGSLTQGFGPEQVLIDPSGKAASDLLSVVAGKAWGLERIAALKSSLAGALVNGHWLPARSFDVLNQLSGSYAMVLDTGSFCTIGEHLWHAGPERPFVGSSNSRAMGTGIPTAIGVACARPGLPVFCLVGDGGVRMYAPELRLAVEEQLPVCFILMTDGRYGSIASVPQSTPVSQRAMTVARPSWWRAVEGMDCEARAVEGMEDFARALAGWTRRGPTFVEAAFAPEPYAAMTAELR